MVDSAGRARETPVMSGSGPTRERLAGVLNAAYGDGLLSERTLAHRLELLFGSDLLDPDRLTGDLTFRGARRSMAGVVSRVRASLLALVGPPAETPGGQVLALDWDGTREELTVGREADCDVVLTDATVSRHHLRLCFRDGAWILHDLGSTNGTLVNDHRVGRCRLIPGDRLTLGTARLLVD